MTSAGWDLQTTAYAALAADGPLVALLGGERLYDHVPQNAAFPYVVIDQMQVSARDAIRVIGAGLRGGGTDLDDTHIARMRVDGGASGFVDIVARLLTATFGMPAASEVPAPGKPLGEAPRQRG